MYIRCSCPQRTQSLTNYSHDLYKEIDDFDTRVKNFVPQRNSEHYEGLKAGAHLLEDIDKCKFRVYNGAKYEIIKPFGHSSVDSSSTC